MVGIISDGFDMNRRALNTMTHLPRVTTARIESMFSGAQAFTARRSVPYNPVGNFVSGGHNSNSFVAGLLTHAGIRPPSMSTSPIGGFPGWGNPIPTHHFFGFYDPSGIIRSL